MGRVEGRRVEGYAADHALAAGGVPSIAPKTLDGVFCFGGDEQEHAAKAAAAKGSDDLRAKALGLLKAADLQVQLGHLQEAAREVEVAESLIRELRFEEGRACLLVLIAKIYAKQGKLSTADQLDEALDLAAEAQEKFNKFGAKKCEAAALLALAAVRYALKRWDDGNAAAKEAQELLEALSDRPAIAEVFLTVADGYLLREDTKRAASWLSKARAWYDELGDGHKSAFCTLRLARVEMQANDRGKATATLLDARRRFKELGYLSGEVAALTATKDFHLNQGRVAEAILACQEIVTAYHDAGDARGEGSSLLNLAELLLDRCQLESCDKVLCAAHLVFTKIRDSQGVAKVSAIGANLKNARLKRQIEESIEKHRDQVTYPENTIVEFGLQQRAFEAFHELKTGL